MWFGSYSPREKEKIFKEFQRLIACVQNCSCIRIMDLTVHENFSSHLDQKWEITPERMIRNHFRESVSPLVIFII